MTADAEPPVDRRRRLWRRTPFGVVTTTPAEVPVIDSDKQQPSAPGE